MYISWLLLRLGRSLDYCWLLLLVCGVRLLFGDLDLLLFRIKYLVVFLYRCGDCDFSMCLGVFLGGGLIDCLLVLRSIGGNVLLM